MANILSTEKVNPTVEAHEVPLSIAWQNMCMAECARGIMDGKIINIETVVDMCYLPRYTPTLLHIHNHHSKYFLHF